MLLDYVTLVEECLKQDSATLPVLSGEFWAEQTLSGFNINKKLVWVPEILCATRLSKKDGRTTVLFLTDGCMVLIILWFLPSDFVNTSYHSEPDGFFFMQLTLQNLTIDMN